MAALIADHDWTGTLGPVADWPQSLKSIVGFLVHSAVPIVLLWGHDGIMIYNDAYSVFAGGRHPKLLGSKVREGWPEVADFNDNVMKVGLAGKTLAYRDQELPLRRSGRPEQVWMNLDYSPVIDESGKPGGVIAIVGETTQRVLAERRQAHAAARQRRQFEQAPGFIIVMNGPEHLVEFVNDTHRKVFGSDDWVGKPIREASGAGILSAARPSLRNWRELRSAKRPSSLSARRQ
ncbi:MAG TPA: PAS domain-containing protein [Rhizomicrobium sp.]